MVEKKIKEDVDFEGAEKEYPITIPDWLAFLNSNATSNMSLYVFLSGSLIAFSIAFTISNIGLNNDITPISLIPAGIPFSIFVIILVTLLYANHRIKHYQRLSQKIIEGKITNPKQVLEEYNKFKKKI